MRFSKPSLLSGLVGILLILTANKVQAQRTREYAILKSGDTVFCKITRSIFGNLSYRVNEDKSIKIRPEEIKEYFFKKDKTPFVSKRLPNGDLEFLALLERGKINLYELSYRMAGSAGGPAGGGYMGGGSASFYYVQKNDADSLYLIKSTSLINKNSPKERRAIFDQFIGDDEELLKTADSKQSFSFKKIRKTINSYNKRNPIAK